MISVAASELILDALLMALAASIWLQFYRLRQSHKKIERIAFDNEAMMHEKMLLSALIENSTDFIGIADPDGNPIYVNPAGRKMVGIAPDFPIQQTQIPDYYPSADREFAQNVIFREMVDKGYWQGETRFRNFKTNEPIPVSDTHFMIYAPDSKRVLGMGTITRDISDRVARFKAEAEAKAKASLLATMSHEIRTPLTVIIGYSELMAEGKLSPNDLHSAITIVHRTSQQLLELINDVLMLSKIESGKSTVHERTFNLPLFTRELIHQFQTIAGDKHLKLNLSASHELPVKIICDEVKLRQILVNLIGNAIKFTQRGEVRLILELHQISTDQVGTGRLNFIVQDTGPGIQPEIKSKIFDKFSESEISYSQSRNSTGLGLNLARQLARTLGGDVELRDTQLGKGSIFVATIPVKIPPESAWVKPFDFDQEAPRREISPKMNRQNVDSTRVLLVEDTQPLQILMKLLLERFGATVQTANDGREAIKAAMSENFDLVLMDIQMPGLNGIAAAAHLRARGYSKPIVALTAHILNTRDKEIADAGFDDILVKPVTDDQLVSCLKKFAPNQQA